MEPTVTLLLGGARSGKSEFAERLARSSGRPVVFLATAVAGDSEMAARIERHRAARPSNWKTVEEPIELERAIRAACRPGDALVIDCVTLWVSNVVLSRMGDRPGPEQPDDEEWAAAESALVAAVPRFVSRIRQLDLRAVIVSNEVGSGVVPSSPLGRRYRDALGRVNRALALRADRVLLMVAGLPIDVLALVPPDLRHLKYADGRDDSE